MNQPLMINENPDRLPFVRYERRPVEDKAASLAAGHYVARDVDYALVTPPYSKDVMIHKADNWFKQLEVDIQNQRIPQQWVDLYKKAYAAWQNGQELPLDGIPIRGWGVISPAQQETLIKMHVLTVESLAAMTSEGINRIGMGGQEMKNKADAWLKQLKGKGAATLEIAELKKENDIMTGSIAALTKKVDELTNALKVVDSLTPVPRETMDINDLLSEDDAS
jgi:hypothetical protein